MSVIKELLRDNGFWTLNKKLVKKLGLEEAFLLSVLVEGEAVSESENDWFYQTADKIEEMTGLSSYKQNKIIKRF